MGDNMEDNIFSNKPIKLFYMPKLKWYKKLWFWLLGKPIKYKELGEIKTPEDSKWVV